MTEGIGDAGTDLPAVAPTEAGMRLDVWLACHMPTLSRSRLQALIREGAVSHQDGAIADRPRTVVQAGDVYHVVPPQPVSVALEPEAIELDICYEDADILVLNKPAGLVVHPAAGHATGTLVHALLHHCHDLQGIGGELRPGIVHRLDKDTSGVMVIAKHEQALHGLMQQFKHRLVRKCYLAITVGIPVPTKGRIETGIMRSRHDRKRMCAVALPSGRAAVSQYHVRQVGQGFGLVEVRIETGRTHQVRVHMAHIGYPLAGDRVYGQGKVRVWRVLDGQLRHMLHAAMLAFIHPINGKPLCFHVPPPSDMNQFGALVGLDPAAASIDNSASAQ